MLYRVIKIDIWYVYRGKNYYSK